MLAFTDMGAEESCVDVAVSKKKTKLVLNATASENKKPMEILSLTKQTPRKEAVENCRAATNLLLQQERKRTGFSIFRRISS